MRELGIMVVLMVLINTLWIGAVGWVTGSTITSAVKALSDDCGTRYGIEKVVAGNWFCPIAEDK